MQGEESSAMRAYLALLVFELLLIAFSAHVTKAADEKLNVHIVPHTHDDVGWTSTVDEYYIEGAFLLTRHLSSVILTTCIDSYYMYGTGIFW